MIKKRLLADSRFNMTLPDERYRAVVETEKFLREILITPRVPKTIKQQARWCLRHYPTTWDMQRTSLQAPDVFMERMDPVHKFIVDGESPSRTENDKSI
jgi:hypothetical protein